MCLPVVFVSDDLLAGEPDLASPGDSLPLGDVGRHCRTCSKRILYAVSSVAEPEPKAEEPKLNSLMEPAGAVITNCGAGSLSKT
jgi:hypothetical protein